MTQKWIPSKKDIEQIETMAGLGLTMTHISAIFGVNKRTIERRIQDENDPLTVAVEKGRAKAVATVTGSLFHMATKRGNVTAAIFWLKCRANWREAETEFGEGTKKLELAYSVDKKVGG